VSTPAEPGEQLSRAERRLVEHLEIVRASPPRELTDRWSVGWCVERDGNVPCASRSS